MSHSWGTKKSSKADTRSVQRDSTRDERRQERKKHEEARQAAVKKNIKITYENMISHISRIPSEALDRDSVVNLVKDVYDWSTYDLNSPIRMPSECGSTRVFKLLPHGATVDSRGTASTLKDRPEESNLKMLDDQAASVVSGSIVSSDHGNEKQYVPIGRVMTDTSSYAASTVAPRHRAYVPPTYRAQQYSSGAPEAFDYGEDPRIADYVPGLPIRVSETPDITGRGPPPPRPTTRRVAPRVGVIKRNEDLNQGPTNITFS